MSKISKNNWWTVIDRFLGLWILRCLYLDVVSTSLGNRCGISNDPDVFQIETNVVPPSPFSFRRPGRNWCRWDKVCGKDKDVTPRYIRKQILFLPDDFFSVFGFSLSLSKITLLLWFRVFPYRWTGSFETTELILDLEVEGWLSRKVVTIMMVPSLLLYHSLWYYVQSSFLSWTK